MMHAIFYTILVTIIIWQAMTKTVIVYVDNFEDTFNSNISINKEGEMEGMEEY